MFKSLEHSDRPFTEADWELSEHMISCWTGFARNGNPGNGWEAYTQDKPEYMIFNLDEDNKKDASSMGRPIVKARQ